MIYPKLTKNQLEEAAKRAEACIVHPYNIKPTSEMHTSERVHLEYDYERTLDAFREFVTPQMVISMIQSIVNPSNSSLSSRNYDLSHELED